MPPIDATGPRRAAGRWVGLCCGALLLLTAAIPWGADGDTLLWPSHLFQRFFAAHFKLMVAAAWAAGLLALLAGALPRVGLRAIVYALAGSVAFAVYLEATRGSAVAGLLYSATVIPYVWLQSSGMLVLLVFLLSTGVDAEARASSRMLQTVSASLLLGLALFGIFASVKAFAVDAARVIPSIATVLAAIVSAMGCVLVIRNSASIQLGRRLVLASLGFLLARDLVQPLFLNRPATELLSCLNDRTVLACTALVALEGWIALSVRFRHALVVAVVVMATGIGIAFHDGDGHIYALPQGPLRTDDALAPRTGDWGQWCGAMDHNMVSDEKGLPDRFDALPNNKTTGLTNVNWVAPLGPRVLGSPAIAGGRVFIGGAATDRKNENALLWCFNESDGALLWRMQSPYIPHLYNAHTYGACATPTLEGGRVYTLGHLGDVLCLNASGLSAGNQGMFQNESEYFATGRTRDVFEISPEGHRHVVCSPGTPATLSALDADILWRYDLISGVDCWPLNALNGAIVIRGERLYVATGSTYGDPQFGDESARQWIDAWRRQNDRPNAVYDSPSLIVLDKNTGTLLARDHAQIFEHTFHGAHSSPTFGTVNGRELLFYGAGDGTCYAFDPEFTPGAPNPPGQPGQLNLVWSFNCLGDRIEQAEIIATPVFYKNRIYVAIGNDLARSGTSAGPGRLVCIDATQTGAITRTGLIWSFEGLRSSGSTVAIADGLLYAADAAGNIYCLDAETGRVNWRHKTAPIWSSPLVADGKVYVGTYGAGLLVFAHAREKKLLAQNLNGENILSSPAVAHGVLYISTQRHLYAIQMGKSGGLVARDAAKIKDKHE